MREGIERRSQGATGTQWRAFDRRAALDGYLTTSRWIREVCAERCAELRFRISVRNREGNWGPPKALRGATLTDAHSRLVIAVLREQGIKARRYPVKETPTK